jgi:hypothetical protein
VLGDRTRAGLLGRCFVVVELLLRATLASSSAGLNDMPTVVHEVVNASWAAPLNHM